MRRTNVNPRLDKYIYSNTAISKKRVNLEPTMMRGGERM